MARYLLAHRHEPGECGVAFAAWKGHPSALRRERTWASCRSGGHAIWWVVDAASAEEVQGLLPYFLAQRATAVEVAPITIP